MGFHTAEGIREDTLGETREKPKVPLIPKKYHLPRSYVEWFCFLTGLLKKLLNKLSCLGKSSGGTVG